MSRSNWSFPVRMMHWLSAVLVLACIGAVWWRDALEKGDALAKPLMQTHFSLGLVIFVATLARLYFRSQTSSPQTSASAMAERVAKVMHVGFYAALLALPVLGYVMASGRGAPVVFFFGAIELPALAVTKELAATAREVHKTLGTVLAATVALHVAAVVWHAMVLRDKVLAGMLGRNKD